MTGRPRLAHALSRIDRVLEAYVARRRRPVASLGPMGPLGTSGLFGHAIDGSDAERTISELLREHATDGDGDDGADLPPALVELGRRFGLDPFERDVVLFAAAPELDGRYARVYAELSDHPGMRRLTVGLAIQVLGAGDPTLVTRLAAHGRLRRWGLCDVIGGGPLADGQLTVPVDVWMRLLGEEPTARFAHLPALSADLLFLDGETTRALADMKAWLAAMASQPAMAVIRGRLGSGRTAAAQVMAGPLMAAEGAAVPDVEAVRRLARDARWADAAVLVALPGVAAATLDQLAALLERPIVVIVDGEPLRAVAGDALPVRELVLSLPDLARRAAMWTRALGEHAAAIDVPAMAGLVRFGPGRIHRAVELAHHRAGAAGPGVAELRDACRELGDVEFGALARRMRCDATWDDLVVPDATRKELELLITWVRLAAERSERSRLGAGLAAVFHGPSGTGKTLAAQVLAATVGLDLYRVDLSQVVNKYIGETEKNLARVFDEAERTNVILFFDEADALFGKRTEVKDAHDRWANIETGFLLQRIEEHPGLAILATNLMRNLDDAHMRRLHVKAEFPRPDLVQRKAIWERHLRTATIEDVDLAYLARQFDLTGGDIRNAVMIGELIARGEHAPFAMRHLVVAAFRELRKAGRLVAPEEFGPWRDVIARYVGPTTTSRSRSNGSSTST